MADNFTVVANDTDIRKQSLPFVIYVNVTPINDEPPVVTVNRIFKVSFPPETNNSTLQRSVLHILPFLIYLCLLMFMFTSLNYIKHK